MQTFVCTKKNCEQTTYPCEFSEEEINNNIAIDATCQVVDGPSFIKPFNIDNTFFCLIVGSRTFNNYQLLKQKMEILLKNHKNKEIVIVSGGAKGADSLAERYALENNYEMIVFRANWDKENKSAGFKRNNEMHKFLSTKSHKGCVAFWDGVSKGTAHNFELAKKYGTQLKIIRV